jgi:hypothetical protein
MWQKFFSHCFKPSGTGQRNPAFHRPTETITFDGEKPWIWTAENKTHHCRVVQKLRSKLADFFRRTQQRTIQKVVPKTSVFLGMIDGDGGILLLQQVKRAVRLPVKHLPKRGQFVPGNQSGLLPPQKYLAADFFVDLVSLGDLLDRTAAFGFRCEIILRGTRLRPPMVKIVGLSLPIDVLNSDSRFCLRENTFQARKIDYSNAGGLIPGNIPGLLTKPG